MIIVTGGAGFIGSAFVWKLNQEGLSDIIIVDALHRSDKWQNLVGLRYKEYYHKDHFMSLLLDESLDNIDAIIHMGACSATTETDSDYLMENNYRFTQLLCEWAIEHEVYFQYASSAATYGDGQLGFNDDQNQLDKLAPINRYGYSKHLFDLYAKHEELFEHIVGLKFFNVFGPNEYHKGNMRSVVCKAYKQILDTEEMTLFKSYRPDYKDGEQMRDFVYVKDCVNVMWWLFKHRHVTGLFNVGTGQARSWKELANALFKAMSIKNNIRYIDMPDALINQYQYLTQATMSKLLSMGYNQDFFSLEDAVEDYVTGYLSQEKYKKFLSL